MRKGGAGADIGLQHEAGHVHLQARICNSVLALEYTGELGKVACTVINPTLLSSPSD